MPDMQNNVLNWASDLETDTRLQAERTARLPFVAGHLALMPDAHFGMGATVGSVIPTQGAIIPAAVGVDIGCGMIAVETDLTSLDLPDNLDALHSQLVQSIPAGVGQGHSKRSEDQELRRLYDRGSDLVHRYEKKLFSQCGTLGSGNHFVEVCLDERDRVWVVLHSGSRGVGNELAKVHIDGAKKLMRRYFINLEDPDLAYLTEGTAEFHTYIADMQWAQDYAMLNREVMLTAALAAVQQFLDRPIHGERINCHHNFTEREHHHGRNLWITRKGAVRARTGDRGVIPGSMGTSSYIVSGLGNPASYESCSHGAGRRMSRGAAKREFTAEDLSLAMKDVRSWNAAQAERLIDEIPASYKDIDQVMEDQRDLVRIDHTLHQILNMKGT